MSASIHARLRARYLWANVAMWALSLVAVTLASFAVVIASQSNPTGGAILAGAIVGVVWFVWPRRADNTPRTLTALLLALYFSTLLPSSVSAGVQLVALAVGYIAWIAQPAASRRGTAAVTISALILVAWAALTLHPNIPSLQVGLLGFRKSALCVAGVALGAAVPKRLGAAVEVTVIRVTLLAVGASIAIHLIAPQLEQLVARSANEYTSEYGGQARLQGFFAGPFHVAFAGLLLLAWGLVRWSRYRILAATSLVVAAAALSMALVRTAFVAAAIVAIVWAIFSPNAGKSARRLVLLVGGGILVLAIWVSTSPSASLFLQSILNVAEDTRYQGRLPGYQNGIDLFFESPIIGWGAGSAGDTLSDYFLGGLNHITSHNIVLKIAVEGGLVGLALWVGLFIAVFAATARRSSERTLIATTLAALVGLGIAVASTETLPVSFIAFMIVGLQLRGRAPAIEEHVDADPERAVEEPVR